MPNEKQTTNIAVNIEYKEINIFQVTNNIALVEFSILPPAKLVTNIMVMLEYSTVMPTTARKYGPIVQVI